MNLNQLRKFKENISPGQSDEERLNAPGPAFDTADSIVVPMVKVVAELKIRESNPSPESLEGKVALSGGISMTGKKNLADDDDLSYVGDAGFDAKNYGMRDIEEEPMEEGVGTPNQLQIETNT